MTIEEIYNKKKDSIYFKKTLEKVSKEALETVYRNNTLGKTCDYFHLTVETIKCLLIHYCIPFHTKEEENRFRVKMNIETRIKNSGSLEESYKKGMDIQRETLIKKYGSLENAYTQQKEKRIKTTLERYGVENAGGTEESQAKSRKTMLEKYGVEYATQIEGYAEKAYKTKLENWGLENFNNWQKGHQTRIEHCGSLEESYKQTFEHYRQTMIERYGVEHTFQLEDVNTKKKYSGPNEYFYNLLKRNNIECEREFNLGKYSYDFKIGNNLIEINPTISHNSTWSPFGDPLDAKYHYNKTKLAIDNGYRCINVWDWDDLDKIIYLIKPMKKLYARNCEVRIVSKELTNSFCDLYHLQGHAKYDISLGLFNNNELVSVMTFGKPRYNKNYEYELIRYCSSYNIVGGAEKLFKHFIKDYNPKSIISYCDLSKFSGKTYTKLGFKFNSVSISKHWYNISTKRHITDNLLRQRGYDQLFGAHFGKGTSNEQLMRESGFLEVYNSGQATFTYKI